MINDIYFVKFKPEQASTKQKIISILGEKWPLTAKQIHTTLTREYSGKITYQAVHKVVQELEKEKIVKNFEGKYQLSLEWLTNSKKAIERIELKYKHGSKIKLPPNFSGSITIEFDNMTDLCVSTAELLLSRQLAENHKDKSFICTMEYGWWTFNFRFEHLDLLYRMVLNNPKATSIIRKKTPFGEWIIKQYIKVGGALVPVGIKLDLNEELFVQGDFVIEVKFDEKTKQLFEKYYNKWHNINDTFIDFGLREPKINAMMTITKNLEMANFFRTQLNKFLVK